MKVYDGPDIRNVALIGHGDSGKTSLTSAMLFVAGAVNRLGRVEDGTATTDFDEEEVSRKISLQTSLAHAEWQGAKINLIDTPGYAAFVADAKAGLAVADAALLLVEAVAGVQVITERVFKWCQEYQVPRIFVLNKLDRENASFERTMAVDPRALRPARGADPDPDRRRGRVRRCVDLLAMKAWRYAKDGSGQAHAADVPAELRETAAGVPREARRDGRRERRRADGDLLRDRRAPARDDGRGLHKAFLERKVFPVDAGVRDARRSASATSSTPPSS
jgi:elongation factor G